MTGFADRNALERMQRQQKMLEREIQSDARFQELHQFHQALLDLLVQTANSVVPRLDRIAQCLEAMTLQDSEQGQWVADYIRTRIDNARAEQKKREEPEEPQSED